MTTVNISLTVEQVKLANKLTKKLGFANRSEFFRAILRRLMSQPDSLEEIRTWPFSSPSTKSKKEILGKFKKTGKYSPEFLKDLAEGLETSDYFTE